MKKKLVTIFFLVMALTLSCSAKTNLSKKQKEAIGGGSAAVGIGGVLAVKKGIPALTKKFILDGNFNAAGKNYIANTYFLLKGKKLRDYYNALDDSGKEDMFKKIQQEIKYQKEGFNSKDDFRDPGHYTQRSSAWAPEDESNISESDNQFQFEDKEHKKYKIDANENRNTQNILSGDNFQVLGQKRFSTPLNFYKSREPRETLAFLLKNESENDYEFNPRESLAFLFQNQSENDYKVEEDFKEKSDTSSDENKGPSSGTDSTPQPPSTVETQEVPDGRAASSVGNQVDSDTSAINAGVDSSQSDITNQQNQGVNTEKGGSTGEGSIEPGANSGSTGKGGGEDIAYDVA